MLIRARNGGIAYYDIDELSTAEDVARERRDGELAQRILLFLKGKLPGHEFLCAVMSDQGVVLLRNELLPPDHSYVVKMADMASDPSWKCIADAASELLERFNVPRSRRNADRWRETKRDNELVRFARGGVLKMVDLSTGRVKHVVPDALAR